MGKTNYLMFVLFTAFVSGLSIFINKFGVAGINASVFTAGKNIITAILLVATLTILGKWKQVAGLNRKNILKLAAIGFFGGSIPFLLFFNGLKLTSATEASFIHKTLFVWAALLSWLFLGEKIEKKFFFGAILLLLGNAVLLNWTPALNSGNLLILAATLLWSVENIISKSALKDIDPEIVAFGRMGFGSLFLLIFLSATGEVKLFFQLQLDQLGWIAVTSGLLFLYVYSWYHGLQRLPVSVATSVLLLGSPITSILSLSVGQVPSISEAVGMVLILVGVSATIGISKLTKTIRSVLPSSSA